MSERTTPRSRRGKARVLPLILVAALAAAGGWWLGRGGHERAAAPAAGAATEAPGEAHQLWTCGMHPQVIQDHPGLCPICHMDLTPLDASAEAGALRIDPVVVQNMGLRVTPVRRASLSRSVRAFGALVEREPDQRDVTLRVGGWIETLEAATEGMRVRKGDVLFELYSPELTVAIQEVIGARRALAASPESATAVTVRDAARRRLEYLGIGPEQVAEFEALQDAPRTVPFLAPADGLVTKRMVYAGARIEPGQAALTLSNNDVLWVDVRVFERDLAQVREGQAVSARFAAAPGETFEGRVLFVHPQLDPLTRSALARAEIPNPDGRLRQGMYATVEIATDPTPDALVVPREAVIDTGVRRVAFVSLGAGRFEPRDVEVGRAGDGGLVQVLAGLDEGEMVVVSGQFLLDAESRIREAIRRHLDRGLPGHEEKAGLPEAGARAAEREAPQARLDALFGAYLAIAVRLGGTAEDADAFDAGPLATAARDVERDGRGETQALARRIAEAAEALARAPREERRKAFAPLSELAIALADRSPPSTKLAPSLFVVHCPMAPGSWLQTHEEVENPFYQKTMKACGEVVRAIPAAEGN